MQVEIRDDVAAEILTQAKLIGVTGDSPETIIAAFVIQLSEGIRQLEREHPHLFKMAGSALGGVLRPAAPVSSAPKRKALFFGG